MSFDPGDRNMIAREYQRSIDLQSDLDRSAKFREEPPLVLGRRNDEHRASVLERMDTALAGVSIADWGDEYRVTATLYKSNDASTDRAGFVIRLEAEADVDDAFMPYARNTPSGCEIYIAGESEAAALVRALKGLLPYL